VTSAPHGIPSPVSPWGLAGLVADRATASPGLRIGIDGPVSADARALADAVAAELTDRAVDVARVRADDFLRARSLRLERGPDDPDAFFDGWYDLSALRREVLDPMAPPGAPGGSAMRSWLPRLRDPVTDRPYREPRRPAPDSTVVVLDGRFLARWDVADAVDVLVHLDVSPAARARRVPEDEQARVLPAWERYLEWCRPADVAALVVRYDRPSHPAVWSTPP
jgi:hypothetical protein